MKQIVKLGLVQKYVGKVHISHLHGGETLDANYLEQSLKKNVNVVHMRSNR